MGDDQAQVGDWIQDKDGYYLGYADLYFTSRDMAKFGLIPLSDGEIEVTYSTPQ